MSSLKEGGEIMLEFYGEYHTRLKEYQERLKALRGFL